MHESHIITAMQTIEGIWPCDLTKVVQQGYIPVKCFYWIKCRRRFIGFNHWNYRNMCYCFVNNTYLLLCTVDKYKQFLFLRLTSILTINIYFLDIVQLFNQNSLYISTEPKPMFIFYDDYYKKFIAHHGMPFVLSMLDILDILFQK